MIAASLPAPIGSSVERITFYSDETGYCVLRLRPHQLPLGRDQLVTVVGTMPELQPGESVRLEGEWSNHPQYGRQFRAEVVTQIRPADAEAMVSAAELDDCARVVTEGGLWIEIRA